MPFYSVRRKDSDEVKALPLMSYTDLQKFLADNPEYEQIISDPPAVKVY
jgi:hypothetical protein